MSDTKPTIDTVLERLSDLRTAMEQRFTDLRKEMQQNFDILSRKIDLIDDIHSMREREMSKRIDRLAEQQQSDEPTLPLQL